MARSLRMVDVGGKLPTRRVAVATGALRMGARAFQLLSRGELPKGDALALGQTAGIMAAKRAPQTIPLCHPLPLERVEVTFALEPKLPGARVRCEAAATASTGVEMEALAGVTGALLAVYDVVKQVDPALTIQDVRLETKTGGKSGNWKHPETVSIPTKRVHLGKASVVTVSDRRSRGQAKDTTGPALAAGLRELGFACAKPLLVPDERARIEGAIARLSKASDAVILTGGTGVSPRDVTPEAVAAACDRLIPGFGEALRARGAASTPMSWLSRGNAGVRGRCVVVALPGSAGGVRDGLSVLAELLPHAVFIARGGDHK